MPKKEKRYKRVIFTPEVIEEAVNVLVDALPEDERELVEKTLRIELASGEDWSHDSEEEFFADYRRDFESVMFKKAYTHYKGQLNLDVYGENTNVGVGMPNRTDVEKVFSVFEANVEKCRLPVPPHEPRRRPTIKVFIGHGQNLQWRDFKDHLHEKHGLSVEAYELGPRAGLTVRDVLDDMLTSSSFAILVLTGEDLDAAGGLHARENVIHELGLFQGRLGWRKAIALLEEGVTEFSNIHGLNQIRFQKGNIQATFGDVLATIKREFPEQG